MKLLRNAGLRCRSVSLLVIILVALSGWSLQTSAAATYSDMFVFGDSLSETGNFEAIGIGGLVYPAPYATGRFSNGPVWVEHLAGNLGLSVSASAAGGNNYAWGGARTGGQPGPLPPFDLGVQALAYLVGTGGVADPDALYVVWGGGNDALAGDVAGSASDIGSIITSLANAGANHFLVPNLPEIGLPFTQFNSDLAAEIVTLNTTLSINLTAFDAAGLFNEFLADAIGGGTTFGFVDAVTPCFSGGTVCADPDSFVLWDTVHPTAAAHTIIGQRAFEALTVVPLPAGVWLLASAAGVLLMRRKRA